MSEVGGKEEREWREESKEREVGLKGIYGAPRGVSPLEDQGNIFLVKGGDLGNELKERERERGRKE